MSVEIPFELLQQMEIGDCVIFVGAGLSMEAGLPGWQQLLSPLAERLRCSSEIDPLKIAQVFEFRHDRRELIAHILEQTDTTGTEPALNLLKLAEMRFKTWITTNYDDLVERALRRQGKSVSRVVSDEDLAVVRSDQTTVIKLHGDRERLNSIIITRHDYDVGLWRSPGIREAIGHLLRTNTFLFIGYSINDPDFNQIHSQIRLGFGGYARRAFAVLCGVDELTVDDLRSRNIEVIAVPEGRGHSEGLSEFVIKLQNERRLTTNVPKKKYYFSDEEGGHLELYEFLNKRGIVERFEQQGVRLVKAEEYMVHSPMAEAGLYMSTHPRLAPFVRQELRQANGTIEEYLRTDGEGNIWKGFAIGV